MYSDTVQPERHVCSVLESGQDNGRIVTVVIPLAEAKGLCEGAASGEQRVQAVLDSLPCGVVVSDAAGHVDYVNRAAQQIWGQTVPTVAATKGEQRRVDAGASCEPETLPECATVTEAVASECIFDITAFDGTRKTISSHSLPLRDPDGAVTGTVMVHSDITARTQAEAAVRRSERMFRATFEQAAVGMARVSPDGTFLEVNRRLCEIVGYSCEELLRLKFPDITHPDDVQADWSLVHQMLSGELSTFSREKRYVREDGSVIWVNLTVSLVRDDAGVPDYMIAAAEDISARKSAEANLLRANFQLDAHLNNTPLAIIEFTPEWTITRWSHEAERLFGWHADEVLGRHIQSIAFLHEADGARAQSVMEDLVSGARARVLFVSRNITKDGREREMEWYGSALRDAGGRLQSVLAFGLDVTARNQSIRRYQVLNEAIPVMAWTAQHDGQRSYVNRTFVEFTGISPEAATGWGWLDAYEPEFREWYPRWWAEVTQKGEPFTAEYRVRRGSDGMYRWHLGRGVPVIDESGRVLEWIGCSTDIHDRKRLEEMLLGVRYELEETVQQRTAELSHTVELLREEAAERSRAEAEIKRSLQEKEVLLKEIHHRVKNNLQVISSLLHMQASMTADQNTRELLRDSENRVLSMALIHEHLYRSDDLSRIALNTYIAQLVANVEASCRSAGSRISCDLRSGPPVAVAVDKAIPCGLIVNELVTNALKHAFPSGKDGTVTISVESVDGSLQIAVADNGIGLPSDFRHDQPRTLGLQIVRTLVRQLRGELIVRGDAGTCFTLRFRP